MFKFLKKVCPFFLLTFLLAGQLNGQKYISGIVNEEIKTKAGIIKVVRTAHLPKGKTISGTVIVEPQSDKPQKSKKQLEKLAGLVLKIGGKRICNDGIFTTSLPNNDETALQVFDESGKIMEEIVFELSDAKENVALDFPKTIQSDKIQKIAGEFSGDISEAKLSVSDQAIAALAGNECELFFETKNIEPGKHELSLDYKDTKVTETVNVIDYTLQAGRLNLNRGESTYLNVKVVGLKDVKEPLLLDVQNQSVGTVSLAGGDFQSIVIEPDEVAGAEIWEKRIAITSLMRGSFSIYTNLEIQEQKKNRPEDATTFIDETIATGEKNGRIGQMKLVNPTNETILAVLNPAFIPGLNASQSFTIPEKQAYKLPPNSEKLVDLDGFCNDLDLPSPPKGSEFISADNWFQVKDPESVEIIQDLMVQEDIQKISLTDLKTDLNVPGTDIPVTHAFNSDGRSELYKRLLIVGLKEIIGACTRLKIEGKTNPVFTENENEKLAQAAFWDYTEKLKGNEVDKIQIAEKLAPQNREDLWKNIELIEKKAKIYPQKSKQKFAQCEFICPQNNTSVSANNVCFEWSCEGDAKAPFNLSLLSADGAKLEFDNITESQFSLTNPLVTGMNYSAALSYTVTSGITEGPTVAFSANSDCVAELGRAIAKLDSLRQIVENASNELENNSLVSEARLIQMINEILESPETITDLFDEWLGEEFSFPDISDTATFETVTRAICANLNNIGKALEYGKKIMHFMGYQNQGNVSGVNSKIDRVLEKLEDACTDVDKFKAFYEELQSAVGDLRGYLAGNMENFVKDKLEESIRRILVNRLGAAAAGSIMSAAMDAWNFIDALIKQGKLEEARALYNLMFFRMLELANQCSRWHIDDVWNSEANGLPQIEWSDCSEVIGKNVKIEAILRCWQQDEDGEPNEGHFNEGISVNFNGGHSSLERRFPKEVCPDCCIFPFQIDMNDLRNKARDCPHAHLIIKVTIEDGVPGEIFGGVLNF